MVDFLNTTGKRIRVLRDDQHLSQASLAVELGNLGIDVGQTYISKLEKAGVMPNGHVIAGLAQALNTTSDYLLMLTDDPFVPGDEAEEEGMHRGALHRSTEVATLVERLERLSPAAQQTILRIFGDLLDLAECR